ncbi:MAG: autotransporter-associated beta strand repeat-containing protein [Chthoniobacterales bacterium]
MTTHLSSLPINSRSGGRAICLSFLLLAVAVISASAQTTRTWTNSSNTQYNNFNNWNPTGTWANGDTLRFNGTVAGDLNLFYQGGQNTGVLLDFTAAQTGAVSISLSNEATASRNFRLGDTNNTVAISIASGAGKVTLNGQSETFRMLSIFGPTGDPGSGQTIFIDNAGTLEFGAFTTLSRAQASRNVDLILRQGGQTTILGRVNDFGTFGGIRVQGSSVLTLSGEWVANTRLMVDEGRADFTSAAAIGTNSAWNSIRVGNNVTSGQLRYTGSGDVEVGRRIQIGNGTVGAQTGSAVIENESATGRLVFTNAIFNADGADALGSGNANTAAARTLTLGGSSTLSNTISGSILDNSTATGGTIGVIKEGAGRWVLSGSNSYTGGTTVSAGTLVLGHTNALSSGGVTVNGGTLDLNGLSVTANQLGGSGGTIALGGGALTVNNTSTTTNASVISGTGSLTKAGGGILVLAGNSTYTGDTFLEAGNIQLGLTDALSTGSVLRFSANANNRRLQMQGFNQTLGGVDSTSATGGTLIIEAASDNVSDAPATLTLDVAAGQSHTFSGFVRNAAGTATNSALTLVKDGAGTQVLSGANVTYSGNTTINAGVLEFAGANSAANNSAITLGGGTVRFAGGGTRGNTISGSGNLEKTGANSLTLSGSNSYTGATTVSAGSLIIGATGSVGGSSVLDVASGATLDVSAVTGGFVLGSAQTLAGNGTVVGDTTISGTLSPGNSAGTLTFADNLTLDLNSTSIFEINGFTSGLFDLVAGGPGSQTVEFGGTLDLTFSSNFSTLGSVKIFDFENYSGGFDNFSTTGLADGYSATFDSLSGTVNVVPEPSTYALLALAAAGLGAHVVRRRRSAR